MPGYSAGTAALMWAIMTPFVRTSQSTWPQQSCWLLSAALLPQGAWATEGFGLHRGDPKQPDLSSHSACSSCEGTRCKTQHCHTSVTQVSRVNDLANDASSWRAPGAGTPCPPPSVPPPVLQDKGKRFPSHTQPCRKHSCLSEGWLWMINGISQESWQIKKFNLWCCIILAA